MKMKRNKEEGIPTILATLSRRTINSACASTPVHLLLFEGEGEEKKENNIIVGRGRREEKRRKGKEGRIKGEVYLEW